MRYQQHRCQFRRIALQKAVDIAAGAVNSLGGIIFLPGETEACEAFFQRIAHSPFLIGGVVDGGQFQEGVYESFFLYHAFTVLSRIQYKRSDGKRFGKHL